MNRVIPFKAMFKTPMLTGQKTQTARRARAGYQGDTFTAWGRVWEITRVYRTSLHEVAQQYEAEGALDPAHFIAIWKGMHPGKGFDPLQIVFVHEFGLLPATAAGVKVRP